MVTDILGVRLWRLHYGAIATVPDRQMTDIDAETAVQDHREDIPFLYEPGWRMQAFDDSVIVEGFQVDGAPSQVGLITREICKSAAGHHAAVGGFRRYLGTGLEPRGHDM